MSIGSALAAVLAVIVVLGGAAVPAIQHSTDQAYWRDLPRLGWLEVSSAVVQRAHLAAIAAMGAIIATAAIERRWPRATPPTLDRRWAATAIVALLAAGAAIRLLAVSRATADSAAVALALLAAASAARLVIRPRAALVATSVLGLAGMAGLAAAAAPPAAGRTNVVLITIDTLRADHMGMYGYARPVTPRLDALAAESRVFLHAYSHGPSTVVAVPALLTGRHPRDSCDGEGGVAPAVHTIAERLRAAGFRTGAVVSNSVLGPHYRGFAEGFEHYDARLDVPERSRPTMERLAPNTTTAALEWIDATDDRPVFLWVHYQDPHGPYDPPPEHAHLFVKDQPSGAILPVNGSVSGLGGIPSYQYFGGRRDVGGYIDRYDAEIHFADEHIGLLIDGLRRRGLLDDAIVVVSSDHGEALGEDGFYFTHGETLQPVLLRVPLIVFDTRTRARGRLDSVVQHLDVVPSLLRRAGVSTGGLPGRDLLAPEVGDAVVLSELLGAGYKSSLISRGIQVVHEPGRQDFQVARGDGRLIPGDPLSPAEADTHANRLRATARRLGAPGRSLGTLPRHLSDQEREALAALGYIDP